MASDKAYLQFVLDQLSGLEEITFRPMMGEYILYYKGRIFGGVYDNRLLIKPVPAALSLIQTTRYEIPYEGAKAMLMVEDIDDREFLQGLVAAMVDDLPEKKKSKKLP